MPESVYTITVDRTPPGNGGFLATLIDEAGKILAQAEHHDPLTAVELAVATLERES